MIIFDVDGTLTPSRQPIDPAFKKWFVSNIKVYSLVTGSDKEKTIEQVGQDIWENAEFAFNCNGNDVYQHGQHVYSNDWALPEDAHHWLSEQLTFSSFNLRTGLHFEHRPGMCNFSIVGRNATLGERKLYVAWDEEHTERDNIAYTFNQLFPNLEAKVGGETGIDIAPKGADKSQILNFLIDKDDIEFHFFGDRMDEKGNDYPLAKVLLDKSLGHCYTVNSYNDTWKYLQEIIKVYE